MKEYLERIVCLLAVCCLPFNSLSAKDVKGLWVSMPDSLAPYLNQKLRTECVDLYEMGAKAEVNNLLKETTGIDTLSARYMKVRLNAVSSMQLCLLPQTLSQTEGEDSVLCVVRTYAGPAQESTVQIFSQQWKLLRTMSFSFDTFIQKPDTMSAARFEEIKNTVDHYFFAAELNPQTLSLTVRVNTAFDFTEDDKLLRSLFVQRNFEWDGHSFK